MLVEGIDDDGDDGDEPGETQDPGELEVLLGALGELDEAGNVDGETAGDEVFDEEEAKEILAAMVKDQVRGGPRRTFAAVNQAKKQRQLARGFGTRRDAGGDRFPPSRGSGPHTYKVSIEALKRRTRCGICKEIGHWHRECPKKGATNAKENHYLATPGSDEAFFVEYLEYLDYVEATGGSTSSSSTGNPAADLRAQQRAGYMDRVHEIWYATALAVPEEHCATVDTGCQRTAVGRATLDKYLKGQPSGIAVAYKNIIDGVSQNAPFLLSLPFLLYCRAVLTLDPEKGLSMHLGRFGHHVPLHIGPTGALRVLLMLRSIMSVKSLAPGQSLAGHLVISVPLDLLCPAMQAPASKRTRRDEPAEGRTPIGRWRRMTLRFIMAMNNVMEQAWMCAVGIRNPGNLNLQGVCRMTRALDNDELMEVQDFIDQVMKSRGLVKEIEDDRASMRQFYRCHKWKTPAQRCEFFQWLEHQPLWKDPKPKNPQWLMPEIGEPMENNQFLRPANVDSRIKNTFYADPKVCEHRHVIGSGTNAYQIQKKCGTCLKLLFQKDRKTGKIMFHDPKYTIPRDLMEGNLARAENTPDSISGFTTPENVSSSDLESTETSSPPKRGKTKPKSPMKPVTEAWEMEPDETEYQEFLAWKRFQDMKRSSTSSGRLFVNVLRRWETVWSELIRCLGPAAQSGVEDLKKKALNDLSRPNKKHLAYYSELLQLSPASLRKVAAVYRPESHVRSRGHVQSRVVMQVAIGSELLDASARESIRSCLRHERPGIVIITCAGSFPSHGHQVDPYGRFGNIAAWKRHTNNIKKTKLLRQFAIELCRLCNTRGQKFVLQVPWSSGGGDDRLLRELLREPGVFKENAKWTAVSHRPTGPANGDLVTNCPTVAKKVTENIRPEMIAAVPADNLVISVKDCYAHLTSRRPDELKVVRDYEVIQEDRDFDENYFTPSELEEIQLQHEKGIPRHEVHAGEDVELPDAPCRGDHPANHGVDEDHLQGGGWQKIDEDSWAYVDKQGGRLSTPTGIDFKPEDFPWRSSWALEEGRWTQIEDEIRWRDLRDQERALPGQPTVVTIFRRKADTKNGRNMRHFPGMQKVTLEKMVRRAHEGLGHPEREPRERFLRILRHSRAPEEVIEIAKNLRCSTCESYRLPDPARRGAPPREQVYVNDLVGIDTIHIRDHRNQAIPAVNIIDWHSHFQLVVPMKGETADHARAAYRQWTRFFGPPRRLMIDLGSEYKAQFRRQAERDGSEIIPSSVEAPYQRGLTERAGGIFKDILYKAMQDYRCQNETEWKELVDTACMTRHPFWRVRVGDLPAKKAMEIRKAAAFAFHAADCEVALRSATLAGPRQFRDYEPGQAVYFWRKGAGTNKKTRESYWHGPGRVVMTALPGAMWIAYQDNVVKAAPERVRPAAEEESLSLSGWLSGLSDLREKFEKMPAKGFVDLTKDQDPIEDDENEAGDLEPPDEANEWPPPARRVRQKTSDYSNFGQVPRAGDQEEFQGDPGALPGPTEGRLLPEPPPGLPAPMETTEDEIVDEGIAEDTGLRDNGFDDETSPARDELENKRELDGGEQPAGKRSRVELLEIYNAQVQALVTQRQRKEATAKDFLGRDAARLQQAIAKEITNNLKTGAYKLLSVEESDKIRRFKDDKIMESRYVITKKPLEPADVPKARSEGLLLDDTSHGPCKAKCRHVMKGFSEAAAVEVECTTPQVGRGSVVFIVQVLASMQWMPGFLDFTQAFHSGDQIDRELYCYQPREGVPGADPRQLIKLLKTCYGLTDGPLAWYKHLARRLQDDFGYKASKADPCVFLLHGEDHNEGQLQGIPPRAVRQFLTFD
ncbi:unnamed protein product [Symbiodinium sp. CCMP2592]|nr:unnamed protein product [Symbiodinium sp. CCMP2592]